MRRAVIVIEWEGPYKKVCDVIDNSVDRLFFDLTDVVPGLGSATSSVRFEQRAGPA